MLETLPLFPLDVLPSRGPAVVWPLRRPSLPPCQPASPTSREGAEHIRRAAATIAEQILDVLREAGPVTGDGRRGGATIQELAVWLRRKEGCCCGRLSELRRAGKIRDSGRTRVGETGVRNTVWELLR